MRKKIKTAIKIDQCDRSDNSKTETHDFSEILNC